MLTLVGAVGVRLVAVIAAVIVPVAGPVLRDAAAAVAFELRAGARVAAACLVAVVSAVIICNRTAIHSPTHVPLEMAGGVSFFAVLNC